MKWHLGMAVATVAAAGLLVACGEDETGDENRDDAAAVGPGITIAEAVSSDLEGPLLVNGFVVVVDDQVRLCESLTETSPPDCAGESLSVEGLNPADLELLRSDGSTKWSGDSIQLLGSVEDGVLTLATTSTASGT